MWTTANAIALCQQIEKFAPDYGCHVALTGGCLYKLGERNDLDILFYRHGNCTTINRSGLLVQLDKLGIENISGIGWRYVGYHHLYGQVDMLFP